MSFFLTMFVPYARVPADGVFKVWVPDSTRILCRLVLLIGREMVQDTLWLMLANDEVPSYVL